MWTREKQTKIAFVNSKLESRERQIKIAFANSK